MNNKKLHTMIGTFLTCCTLWFSSVAQAADIASAEEALYTATQIRTLSQRMLKNYVLAGLGIRARKATDALNSDIAKFDTQLSALQQYAQDDGTRNSLRTLAEHWPDAKAALSQAPNKDKVEQVRSLTETLLQDSAQVAGALSSFGPPNNAELIELSGQQAMLSQRIASTYALMAWGYADKYRESYDRSYSSFQEMTANLEQAAASSPGAAASLKKIKRQFKRIKPANKNTFVPGLVDRSAEKLLTSIEALGSQFAGLK